MNRNVVIGIIVAIVAIAVVVIASANPVPKDGWAMRDLNEGTVATTITSPTLFMSVEVSGLKPGVALYTVPEGQGLKNGHNVLWHNTVPGPWQGTTALEVCASTKDEGPAPDMSGVTITPVR